MCLFWDEAGQSSSFSERAETMASARRSAYLAGMFERVKHGVFFVAALAAIATSAWAPAHARACSCMETSFERARSESSAIFEGRVVGTDVEDGMIVVHFRVTQAWRGVEHEVVDVRTASNSAACGYAFETNVVYLVYAQAGEAGLQTGLCSRTSAMDGETAQGDRLALGSGTIPVDIEDAPPSTPHEQPARGGCASCTTQSAPMTATQAWLALGGLAFVATRASRRRER